MPSTDAFSIVIVDDDDVDRRLLERSLRKSGLTNPIVVAEDGVDALEVLTGSNRPQPEWPYIIMLDMNMPRMDGLEFLRVIRSDPSLRHAVVFVLTTSDDESDVAAAYGHQVAGYIVKNGSGVTQDRAVALIKAYNQVVRFPAAPPTGHRGAGAGVGSAGDRHHR